jgi:hypothetical protein
MEPKAFYMLDRETAQMPAQSLLCREGLWRGVSSKSQNPPAVYRLGVEGVWRSPGKVIGQDNPQ